MRRHAAAVIALALLASGCGNDDAESGGDESSSPFTVAHEPAGYWMVGAGRGEGTPVWGEDEFGTSEAVTVLAPDGEDAQSPQAVLISATGFANYQGGLEQGARCYTSSGCNGKTFEVDDRMAIYSPAWSHKLEGETPAEVLVQLGDDVAVRVASFEQSRDVLIDVANRVIVAGNHFLAPGVSEPPDGFKVVGSADSDVAGALLAEPLPKVRAVTSSKRGHAVMWARGEQNTTWKSKEGTIQVTTLPDRALDLDALPAVFHTTARIVFDDVQESEVAGRAASILEYSDVLRFASAGEFKSRVEQRHRAIVTASASGDVLVVAAQARKQAWLPDVAELTAVAESVTATDQKTWDELVATSFPQQ